MESVMRQWKSFHQELLVLEDVVPEESFLLFLQTKLDAGQISLTSANQYITYWKMDQVPQLTAFRKTMRKGQREWERRQQVIKKVCSPEDITKVVFEGSKTSFYKTVLCFQWALAARFIDLQCLKLCHISVKEISKHLEVCLVGGKTDPSHTGQLLLLPLEGRFSRMMRTYLGQIGGPLVFPGLSRPAYNRWLLDSLNTTSHYIRHSALTAVAQKGGHSQAAAFARHASEVTTTYYIPQNLWMSSKKTAIPAEILQN
eukprot:TRINITY_DN10321_c1_g1_i1.p3 TRINITY_DN10321_c1_g1~~TRINITY_DN10321_c1_g1_i1.p3  ORF type:complete len:257 (-),score=18.06 TRINITY_DN10321_c1_g1_i1:1782-2552(-)